MLSTVDSQDIEWKPDDGFGGRAAGAAATVRGGGGGLGAAAGLAPFPALLWSAPAVPGAPEAPAPAADPSPARTSERGLQ